MHWPMQIAFRIAPGPATRASGLRQRTPQAMERRNRRKADRGYGPLAKQLSGRSSGSQADPTGRSSGSQHWQAGGRSSGSQADPTGRSSGSHCQAGSRSSGGSWWESSEWDSWRDDAGSWTGGGS